jgi:hypothetical protein
MCCRYARAEGDRFDLAEDMWSDVRTQRFGCDDFHRPPEENFKEEVKADEVIKRLLASLEFDQDIHIATGGGVSPHE